MLSVNADDPWCALTGFRVAGPAERRVRLAVAGSAQVVELTQFVPNAVIADVEDAALVFSAGEAWQFGPERADSGQKASAGNGAIVSPMPGVIAAVNVTAGDAVIRGQRLLVVEAMKMEYALLAPFAGTVTSLHAGVGQHVAEGALLARVETKQEV
jgi:3-methylcrotonyl-CoA carboxylase alpha subunit